MMGEDAGDKSSTGSQADESEKSCGGVAWFTKRLHWYEEESIREIMD
jgi:hypothetical protein